MQKCKVVERVTTAVIIGIATLLAVLSVFLRVEARLAELEERERKHG